MGNKSSSGEDTESQQRKHPKSFLIQQIKAGNEEDVLSHIGQLPKSWLNHTNKHGETALCAAITYFQDDSPVTQELITAGADVNKPDSSFGWTPLFRAVKLKRDNAMRLLLQAGAKVNLPVPSGPISMSPIWEALHQGSITTTQVLLEAGADPNLYNPKAGHGLLMQAIAMHDLHLCRLYFPHNTFSLEALQSHKENIVEISLLLLDHKADPTLRDKNGYTCLHKAVTSKAIRALKVLLKLNVIDVNDKCNKEGVTPLQKLSCNHTRGPVTPEECTCVEIARCLVQAGADVNMVTYNGAMSPLYKAVRSDNLELVQFFIDQGYMKLKIDNNTDLLNNLNTSHRMLDLLTDVLLQEPAPQDKMQRWKLLEIAIHNADVDVLRKLLSYNSNLQYWNAMDKHLLLMAAGKKSVPLCKMLLDHGADVNIEAGTWWKEDWYNRRSQPHFIGYGGLPHDPRCRSLQHPLAVACRCVGESAPEQLPLVELLVSCGADVNIPDGNTMKSTLHSLTQEKFSHMSDRITNVVKMYVSSGLDLKLEYWLPEKLQPGVPFGNPGLRSWLERHIVQPAPLRHQCIVYLRVLFGGKVRQKVPLLPIPKLLQDTLLLKDLYTDNSDEI